MLLVIRALRRKRKQPTLASNDMLCFEMCIFGVEVLTYEKLSLYVFDSWVSG